MIKLIDLMKNQKDRMNDLMPQVERVQLINTLKATGNTHFTCTTVIGHPNFLAHTTAWITDIRQAGLKVTFRNAHQLMEGLYGNPASVGLLREPSQFWIDEAVNMVKILGSQIQSGDQWAIYPERTEGVFQDSTSWIDPSLLPGSYTDFFINLNNSCAKVLPAGIQLGLSSNNASELLSGWLPSALSDYAAVVCVDLYRDGNTTQYESDIRAINARYGKPVFVQEGAPNRFSVPNRLDCDAYYSVNKKLANEGILVGFGDWGGWAGTPEALVDVVNGQYVLNNNGLSLQDWWNPTPLPIPTPPPLISVPSSEHFVALYGASPTIALTDKGRLFKYSNGTWTIMPLPKF